MQLGVIFPQTEIGADPAGVRDFAQATEDMGYAHLIVFDHVLGADVSHYPDWAVNNPGSTATGRLGSGAGGCPGT